MALDCSPEVLAEAARCYACIPAQDKEAIKIYLLSVLAGLDNIPVEDLVIRAKCYSCIPARQQKGVENYLLCQIASGITPS